MQVSLHATAWHRRLQSWTFPNSPRFDNLCPYFWLTVLCLIASPITATLKALMFVLVGCTDTMVWILSQLLYPFEGLAAFIGERFDPTKQWRHQRYIRNMPDAVVYYYWRVVQNTSEYFPTSFEQKAAEILETWKAMFSDWDERLERIIAEQKAIRLERLRLKEEQAEIERQRRIALRRYYTKLANITQKVMKPVLIGVAISAVLVGLGYVGYGIYWAFTEHLRQTLVALGITTAFIMFVALIAMLQAFFDIGDKIENLLGGVFALIFDNPVWPFVGRVLGKLLSPFKIFVLYVKAVLDNNCPAIEWQEPKDA